MLQETVTRLTNIPNISQPIIVCNEDHRFLVAEQIKELGQQINSIILEPIARNTAPAVAIAALQAQQTEKNPILLVLPADHEIDDTKKLHEAINAGLILAKQGLLVTLGIIPSTPETGYGYILKSTELLPKKAFRIKEFVEKPNKKTANTYMESGDYLWNSGIFIFQAQQYLDELHKHEPKILDACKNSLKKATNDLDFIRLDKKSFELSPSNSIDYAIMEKTQNAAVVLLDAGWSDVGSWASLWESHNKDANGNVLIGETLQVDTKDSLIYSSGRLVTTVGVQEHIIIETADAVLVAHKNKSQDVKNIVELLEKSNCQRSSTHRKVFRPWGNYDCIDAGHRFQVKRIVVNPGATLSLQMHHHRAEHWIIVKGTAKVTKDEETFLLEENQSTYIPLGVKHRLENPGSIPLEIIEIQSGSYLGEDDIVRFEDIYGRSDEL